jgi:serine/threonine protein kinase
MVSAHEGEGVDTRFLRKRSPTRPPPPATQMPRRLGPYRLCMEIGSGGMATVYLARVERSAGLRRFVALKRLRPHVLEQASLAEMFFDEVNITSQLNHPNVCSVLDFDARPENHYLAMEYLMGESLSSLYGALASPGEHGGPALRSLLAARVVAESCEGLHAAHELRDFSGKPLDVVHRDVSPDNIFLTYDGIVKVVDFGVACAAGQKHETRTGIVKGKVAYLAPEVVMGQRPDRRADIWALGVVLWEVLTMHRLFRRDSDLETLHAVRDAKVMPPSWLIRDLGPAFDDIVMHALARDPAKRFTSARELGRELQSVMARRGTAFGAPELSELMGHIFPGGREHKRQLLEAASEIDDDDAREAAPPVVASCAASGSTPRFADGSGTAELHTGDLSFASARPARTARAFLWLAAPTILLTAYLSYAGCSAPDRSHAAATPASLAVPAPARAGAPPPGAPTTIVLKPGTYVLDVRGEDDAQLQPLAPASAPAAARAAPVP